MLYMWGFFNVSFELYSDNILKLVGPSGVIVIFNTILSFLILFLLYQYASLKLCTFSAKALAVIYIKS